MSGNIKTYKSKIDLWLVALLAVSIVLPVIIAAFLGTKVAVMSTLAISLPMTAFVIWLFKSTRYELTQDMLIVRAGLYTLNIPFDSIVSVTPTRNPLSSPALSLDRLDIRYGHNKRVLVSPADKPAFLTDIGWADSTPT